MPADAGSNPTRIAFLDEVRGLCCILMVIHHAFYTAGYVYGADVGRFLFDFFAVPGPFFAGLFILICGLCCRFSRSNLKRGLLLLAVALGMSLFLLWFMPQSQIWYGILNVLASGILLYAAAHWLLDRVPPAVGIAVCAVLTLLCWNLPVTEGGYLGIPGLFTLSVPTAWRGINWLFPLGLSYGSSADYFPFLKWIWVFLAGVFLGRWAKEGRFPAWMSRPHAPWLSFVGHYTLWMYIAHQPVIYGLFWALSALHLFPAAG